MRNILAIAGKEFRHLAHDRFSLSLVLFIPFLQLIVYGYALETRFRNLPAALLNQDTHIAGQMLATRISRSPLLSIDPTFQSEAQIQTALRLGTIRVAIVIPPDFSSNLLNQRPAPLRVWVDGADVATSNYLLAALDALGLQATIEQSMATAQVQLEPVILFNPTGRSAAFLLPALIAILVQMVCTLLLSLAISGERERGTLEQLLITPIGLHSILLGKSLMVAIVGLSESVALLLLLRWLFDVPVAGSVVLLALLLPLLVIAPIGAALMIAARAKTQSQALQLSQILFLPSVLLSGFLLPREFLNYPLNWIGDLIPTTYLIRVLRSLILRGASWEDLAGTIGIASLSALAFLIVGYWTAYRALTLRRRH